MRVGIDTFTLRDLKLNPFEQLDFIHRFKLEGAQFGGVRHLSANRDPGELKALRARADELGLYSHVSLSITCNPHLAGVPVAEQEQQIRDDITAAAACGWHELHASMGGGNERYEHPVPWTRQLTDTADLIRRLGPVLRQHASRINIETHGDVTTFELIRLIEATGPDIAGICLDTANVLCQCEDPVEAARRAAPYTHLTHLKDGAIAFLNTGYRRQTLPAGRGMLDWRTILPILAASEPNLPLSIEDHKWLFDFHVFDDQWIRLHPDLTREEFARVMQFGWRCHQRMAAGSLPDPVTYEKKPHVDEVEDRLAAARDHLKAMIRELGLTDRTDHLPPNRNLTIAARL
ncbi:MAG: hypothetical protein A2498_14295 [Lentisphaerae bacterium RIFOXYC12_FULL_60_16]|nr:MAG: hypothetical protein A2498_14295 [Lentisphaerae bacterium RIFOXYC12_FULL_60_16]